MRDALPGARITTMSEYLQRHADEVREMVDCLVEYGYTREWTRRVESDGSLRDVADDVAADLAIYGMFRDGRSETEESGLLPPNIYNVLFFAVLESLDYQTDVVKHLSGPDMIEYVRDMAPELNRMYQTVVEHTTLGQRLPTQLHFQIVPTAHARFVAPSDRQTQLDQLVDGYDMWTSATREGRGKPGWEAAAQLGSTAVQAAVERYFDPFIPARTPQYLSHNDVRAARVKTGDGSGLYVPTSVRRKTFAELRQMHADIRWLIS
jgi:hypothetical protein